MKDVKLKIVENYGLYKYWKIFLSFISTLGIVFYFDFSLQLRTSSFLLIFVLLFFYKVWERLSVVVTKPLFIKIRNYLSLYILSIIFSFIQVTCKYLENGVSCNKSVLFLISIFFSFSIYPLLLILLDYLIQIETKEIIKCSNKMQKICFCIICVSWLFVWLAAFPGIYANDAFTWYREFDNTDVPVTDRWSPVYAGIFYFFVHTGYVLAHNYEVGLAVFSFLQMILILVSVYKMHIFLCKKGGKIACVLTTIFFSLPTHAILSVQTSLDAPFTACFSLVVLTIIEILEGSNDKNIKMYIKLIVFIILSAILRWNGYVAFFLIIPFVFLVKKQKRVKIFLSFFIGIAVLFCYKTVLLPNLGIEKYASSGITIGVPLQQMSATYNRSTDKLSESEKKLIEDYISKECLHYYFGLEQLTDWAYRCFNEKKFKENPFELIKLYIKLGIKFPKDYTYAFLVQELGMFYMDKQYPEPQIWHAYIDYGNYFTTATNYCIGIKRKPLFPLYDKFLLFLFGDSIEGYGGVAKVAFDNIPVFSVLCRASTYFWALVLLTYFSFLQHKKEKYFILCIIWCFSLTAILAPLIMYRYWAPIIFIMPVLICDFLIPQTDLIPCPLEPFGSSSTGKKS